MSILIPIAILGFVVALVGFYFAKKERKAAEDSLKQQHMARERLATEPDKNAAGVAQQSQPKPHHIAH